MSVDPIQQPCPPQDDEIVSALDNEIQRLATLVDELPFGPSRENPLRRIVRLRLTMERYISQHSSAGWPSFYQASLSQFDIGPKVREHIRSMARDLKDAEKIPKDKFPGEKSIYCANLAACLGAYAIPLLNALEEVER